MTYQIVYMGQVVASVPWLLLARRIVREYRAIGLCPKLVANGKVID